MRNDYIIAACKILPCARKAYELLVQNLSRSKFGIRVKNSSVFETESTYSSLTIQKNKCPEYGVITVSDRGRLGNLMSQYATLYAYSKLLNRQPVISQHMSDTLLKVFPSASIPSSSICKLKIQHCVEFFQNPIFQRLYTKDFFPRPYLQFSVAGIVNEKHFRYLHQKG